MTVKIPVGTGQGAPIALDDWERVNFVQLARDGIAGAQSRNDAMTLAMLQSALQMMQGDHGANISRPASSCRLKSTPAPLRPAHRNSRHGGRPSPCGGQLGWLQSR